MAAAMQLMTAGILPVAAARRRGVTNDQGNTKGSMGPMKVLLKKRWLLPAGAVAALAFASTASAAVTFDPTCSLTPSNGTGACGFVGKGDVQLALGYNNTQMQKNAGSLAFTGSQAATQALSEDGATQALTQPVSENNISETLSCTNDAGPQTFYRDGSRTGTRAGSQLGSRTGSRTGTQDYNVSYAIAFDPRVKNQIDGFLLKSATSSGFVPSGNPAWGGYMWGDTMWGDPTWGDPTWSDWTPAADSTGSPGVCDSSNPNVVPGSIQDSVSYGDISYGDISYGDITAGTITPGAVTPNGPATLYVNGKALN